MSKDTIYRQDVIETLEKSRFPGAPYIDTGIQIALREIKALPTAQPEKGEWILCSERLPEESGRYLISVLDGVGRRTTVAPYQPRYKAWTMTGRMAYWKVIAWLPLPEPYRGEEK